MRFPKFPKVAADSPPVVPPSILRRRLQAWMATAAPLVGSGLKERAAYQLVAAGLSNIPDEKLEEIAIAVHRELGSMLAEHFGNGT